MRRFPTTHPSPALIVAMISLVLALAGTALAGGTTAKLSKGQVKAIAANQVEKLAPGLDVNSAKIARNVLSANVLANGAMLGSIPGGATSTRTALGNYTVSFGRDLTGCTISASAASNEAPQVALVAVGLDSGGALNVFTRTGANVVADEPFYVQAICPG